jgi:5'(3')-deoxyribonucleotidase
MNRLNVTINFDMDGTIADLYGVDGWLEMLTITYDETPYATAKPLIRLCTLARMLNKLQKEGYKIAVLSWLAKGSNADYDERVTNAKMQWLEKHLPSVCWDKIIIVPHGTPKEIFCETPFDILFDDEVKNRKNWNGIAFDVDDIFGVLKTL